MEICAGIHSSRPAFSVSTPFSGASNPLDSIEVSHTYRHCERIRERNEDFLPERIYFSESEICLVHGTLIHAHVIKYGFENSHVGALLMHSRNVEDASQGFDLLSCKDVVSWSTILSIFAYHGHGDKAVEILDEMLAAGISFDSISLLE